jgi:hypothetical protein
VLTVKYEDRKMRRFARNMPKMVDRSVARALNKAITRTRTLAARLVSDKRNIKVGRARADMRLVKASPAKPTAMIKASGSAIPVIEVKGVKRQTKKGVTAKVVAKAKPHLFAGAFIAEMPSGHVGVFKRKKGPRLPIVEQKLPSVPATMIQEAVEDKLSAFAWPVYEKELRRLLELEMAKAGGR